MTLKIFHFHSLIKEKNEFFITFCTSVEKEAKHCHFKCSHGECTAEATSVREQVMIRAISNGIQRAALKKYWDLNALRRNVIWLDKAAKGSVEISGDFQLKS